MRIRLLDAVPQIKSGLFAKGVLKYLQKSAAVYLLKNTVLEKDGQYYVYVLADGKAVKRNVVTGAANSESVEIVQGLQEGEQVIIDNLARLRNNLAVEVAQGEAK